LTDSGFGGCQLRNVELLRGFVCLENSGARADVTFRAAVFIGQRVVDLLRDALYRFLKGEVLKLLQEREYITTLAATETVVIAGIGPYVKTGRLFVVKWAQSLERINPRSPKSNMGSDDIGNVGARSNLVNV
jgi:hypothetical protein